MPELPAAAPDTLHAYEHVFGIYWPIAAGVFGAVVLLLIVLLAAGIRRKRPGGRHEALPLETAYAILLGCVVAFLLYVTFSTETPIDHPVSDPSLKVDVVASQWAWRFEYPDGVRVIAVDTWRPRPAYVPEGVEVQFTGTSRDVIHGFWVPRLHFQRQMIPGYLTRFDLRFDTGGYYLGVCSVYCGERHSQMHFAIQAVSRGRYERWLAEQQAHGAARGPRGLFRAALQAGRKQ